jgi:hypothetical protein
MTTAKVGKPDLGRMTISPNGVGGTGPTNFLHRDFWAAWVQKGK